MAEDRPSKSGLAGLPPVLASKPSVAGGEKLRPLPTGADLWADQAFVTSGHLAHDQSLLFGDQAPAA